MYIASKQKCEFCPYFKEQPTDDLLRRGYGICKLNADVVAFKQLHCAIYKDRLTDDAVLKILHDKEVSYRRGKRLIPPYLVDIAVQYCMNRLRKLK